MTLQNYGLVKQRPAAGLQPHGVSLRGGTR